MNFPVANILLFHRLVQIRHATNELFSQAILAIFVACVLAGCASRGITTMMPAPVIYHDSAIDPFAHLEESRKDTKTQVFYATNRKPKADSDELEYGNFLDDNINLGEAFVQMGGQENDWNDLYKYSLADIDIGSMPIFLGKTTQIASMKGAVVPERAMLPDALQRFIDSINRQISLAVDKEIMIYVHGAKVDFANSVMLTAEIDHFSGRDFVSMTFAWPSHQNILAYLAGIDVRRARNASSALKNLLVLLADYTDAEHINVLAYSAGGKVASKALFELGQSFADLRPDQLKDKFRLGAVVLAAADVEIDIFLERLPSISKLANQVVITVTDNDYALQAAEQYMGGAGRVGSQESEIIEENFIVSQHLSNVEIVDVSLGKEIRGFDIEGHHYWYRHPWMSSDIIFLMRTDLPPVARGLTPAQMEGVWYFSPDYPEKIRGAVKNSLMGQW